MFLDKKKKNIGWIQNGMSVNVYPKGYYYLNLIHIPENELRRVLFGLCINTWNITVWNLYSSISQQFIWEIQ